MNYIEAIELVVNQNKLVRRRSWKNSNLVVEFNRADTINAFSTTDCFYGSSMNFIPSKEDVDATDWYTCEYDLPVFDIIPCRPLMTPIAKVNVCFH